jgi:uncharacterized damage-inducible protein DinB
LADLKPHEWHHQPVPGANSAAWVVGHLTFTDRRILTRLGEADLPAVPDGYLDRFAMTRSAATPQDDLGDPAELLGLFAAHRSRLVAAVRAADPAKLAEPMPSASGMFATLGQAAVFMGQHTMLHLGQVTTIRRSLGYPPVV